jgi:hypothetical protein
MFLRSRRHWGREREGQLLEELGIWSNEMERDRAGALVGDDACAQVAVLGSPKTALRAAYAVVKGEPVHWGWMERAGDRIRARSVVAIDLSTGTARVDSFELTCLGS